MQLYFQQLNYFQYISFALLQENSSRLKILKAHYLCHYTVSLQLQKIFPGVAKGISSCGRDSTIYQMHCALACIAVH